MFFRHLPFSFHISRLTLWFQWMVFKVNIVIIDPIKIDMVLQVALFCGVVMIVLI
jgi:hypothetical protein